MSESANPPQPDPKTKQPAEADESHETPMSDEKALQALNQIEALREKLEPGG